MSCVSWFSFVIFLSLGLRAFVFRRGVPGVTAPTCPCRLGDQTAANLFTECAGRWSQGMRSMGFSTEEVWEGLSDYKRTLAMTRTLVRSGWLLQFKVFNELRQQDEMTAESESAWARRPPSRAGAARSGPSNVSREIPARSLTMTAYIASYGCCKGFHPA